MIIKRYTDSDLGWAYEHPAGEYVRYEDHEAAMRTLRGDLNTSSWRTMETLIDAMAKEFFADDKAEALAFANKAVKAARLARTNPEEGA